MSFIESIFGGKKTEKPKHDEILNPIDINTGKEVLPVTDPSEVSENKFGQRPGDDEILEPASLDIKTENTTNEEEEEKEAA